LLSVENKPIKSVIETTLILHRWSCKCTN